MEFSRQECWCGLPFPSPGDRPDSGIKAASPALAGGFFTAEPPGKPVGLIRELLKDATTTKPWTRGVKPGNSSGGLTLPRDGPGCSSIVLATATGRTLQLWETGASSRHRKQLDPRTCPQGSQGSSLWLLSTGLPRPAHTPAHTTAPLDAHRPAGVW